MDHRTGQKKSCGLDGVDAAIVPTFALQDHALIITIEDTSVFFSPGRFYAVVYQSLRLPVVNVYPWPSEAQTSLIDGLPISVRRAHGSNVPVSVFLILTS